MDPVFALTLRIGFAYLFASAAIHKLCNLPSFRYTLARYELVPEKFVGALSVIVVSAETYIALRMLLSSRIQYAAAAVLTAYSFAIALNVVRGRTDLDCGCMGPAARTPLSWWLVARNMVLVFFVLLLSSPVTLRPLTWLDAVLVVGATALMIGVWVAVERLLMVTVEPPHA
jgi:hypothetical protein